MSSAGFAVEEAECEEESGNFQISQIESKAWFTSQRKATLESFHKRSRKEMQTKFVFSGWSG